MTRANDPAKLVVRRLYKNLGITQSRTERYVPNNFLSGIRRGIGLSVRFTRDDNAQESELHLI